MGMKIVLNIVGVVMERKSEIQGNAISLALILYSILTYVKQPYENRCFNELNTVSNVALIVSIKMASVEQDFEGEIKRIVIFGVIWFVNAAFFDHIRETGIFGIQRQFGQDLFRFF